MRNTSKAGPVLRTFTPNRINIIRARFSAHWRIVVVFAALIFLAAAVRLLTYQRYLPYNDLQDEGGMLLLGRDWRGVEKIAYIPHWLAGYPPLYVWMNMGVQEVVEKLDPKPWVNYADYYYALRFLSALSGIVTTLLVIWLGWQLAGPIAGWFAGLAWGLAPIIIVHGNFALADPFVFLTCAASLVMALRAWAGRSPVWSFGSLIAAILAIYLKYSAVFVLIPWAIVAGVLFWKNPRRFWCWCVAELVVGILAAAYLVVGYGAFRLNNDEAARFVGSGSALMLNPARSLSNALTAIWPIGVFSFFSVMVLGMVAYDYCRQRPLVDWRKIALLLLYSGIGIVLTSGYYDVLSTFGVSDETFKDSLVRYLLPVTVALCAVWGACIAQIASALNALEILSRARGYRRLASAAFVAVAGIAVGTPFLISDARLIARFRLPDTRYLLWRWTDANIPADGLILMKQGGSAERAWNRYWGGYDGVKTFQWWWIDKNTFRTPLRQLVNRNIVYFVTSDEDQQKCPPEAATFIRQLTLLKVIRSTAAAPAAGPTLYFYRLMPPQFSTHVTFSNQISLVGYDLNGRRFSRGAMIRFRPYWRAVNRPIGNYSMFVHLDPGSVRRRKPLAQYDGPPSTATRPPITWDDPNELYIGPDATLTVPADLKPGTYQLDIGLYNYLTAQRLQTDSGRDTIAIPVLVDAGDVF
jgi:hypothetical protein